MSTAAILDRILQSDRLPSPPAVAIKLLQLIEKEDVAVAEVAKLVEADPATSARLLKLANSALYGFPTRIASVRHATVVLGLRAVKVAVCSFDIVHAFREKGSTPRMDVNGHWRRSLTTALVAKEISDACGSIRARRGLRERVAVRYRFARGLPVRIRRI